MNTRRDPTGAAGDWHASPALLAAYAESRASNADTWSVEAHLVGCPRCRTALMDALSPADRDLLGGLRHSVIAGLPQRKTTRTRRSVIAGLPRRGTTGTRGSVIAGLPQRGTTGTRRSVIAGLPRRGAARIRHRVGWLRWVVRPGSLIAVAVAVLGALVLDLVAGVGDRDGGMVWLLAPAIPVLGVALAAIGEDDPCWDAVLAAPSALLRLTLLRTLAVLTLAVPLASVAGILQPAAGGRAGWNAAWLLPCLALTALTLAAGAFVGVERAARGVVLLWCAATLGPPLLRTGGDVLAAIRLAAAPLAETSAFTAGAQPVWAVVVVLSVGAVVLTRGRYGLSTYQNGSHR
ncbi:hypothetical protein DMB66_04365 [Actinoplanes sp. ATCC 53533]|uniref:zf-HC2 domain-containing protein n=1 Tax=Actinoplanes sp. ATCC 53533 TaxID=1288362 RepID=UPI000F7B80B1|nr:zf-HC2 domain-containing protein [Actinoplanes sp. ATCC 53533]RSM73257.1 hypothetical protein DMB66_04365 [Actinoplanes sp. ATCC 53533]